MQNTIEREITIRASKKRIYEAIAMPEQVILWFPNSLEGDYEVGQQPIFDFGDQGRNRIYIVDSKPYDYFAYRWVPGANQHLGDVLSVANTLVEFFIEEESEGLCKVTLKESGFAELPTEWMEAAFNDNSGGWDFMLGRLIRHCQDE
jgi:uncharacterized protein YndB with AHSA1/START domain